MLLLTVLYGMSVWCDNMTVKTKSEVSRLAQTALKVIGCSSDTSQTDLQSQLHSKTITRYRDLVYKKHRR